MLEKHRGRGWVPKLRSENKIFIPEIGKFIIIIIFLKENKGLEVDVGGSLTSKQILVTYKARHMLSVYNYLYRYPTRFLGKAYSLLNPEAIYFTVPFRL